MFANYKCFVYEWYGGASHTLLCTESHTELDTVYKVCAFCTHHLPTATLP